MFHLRLSLGAVRVGSDDFIFLKSRCISPGVDTIRAEQVLKNSSSHRIATVMASTIYKSGCISPGVFICMCVCIVFPFFLTLHQLLIVQSRLGLVFGSSVMREVDSSAQVV